MRKIFSGVAGTRLKRFLISKTDTRASHQYAMSSVTSQQEEFESLEYLDDEDTCENSLSQLMNSSAFAIVSENESVQNFSEMGGESEDDEININFLRERCEGDMDIVAAIASSFCDQGAECCWKMVRSMEAGQIDEVEFQAVRF